MCFISLSSSSCPDGKISSCFSMMCIVSPLQGEKRKHTLSCLCKHVQLCACTIVKEGVSSAHTICAFPLQEKWKSQWLVKNSEDKAWKSHSCPFISCCLTEDCMLILGIHRQAPVSSWFRKIWINLTSWHAVKPAVCYEMSSKCSKWAVYSRMP